MANEIDQYALDYLKDHNILEPNEELLAYYDATMSMDGTEAAILTTERILYHKANRTTAIHLEEVVDIQHRYESWTGDIIEVTSASGKTIKIVIAPLNQGETFLNVLMKAWGRSREQKSKNKQ